MPNLPRKNVDPYRELGVARGASNAEIKKAHRALAKKFHPDAAGGDTGRFLAVQEAYSLLSDPLRRREWDARHSPSPVRANEPRKPRPRGADGRWTREEGARSTSRQRSPSQRRQRPPEPPRDADVEGGTRQAGWSGNDRPSGTRSYRWSAENVPWWEDFAPRNGAGNSSEGSAGAGSGRQAKPGATHGPAAGAEPRSAPGEPPQRAPGAGGARGAGGAPGARHGGPDTTTSAGQAGPAGAQGQGANEFDVYSRSSGAAWSSAARQYFRKASEDLPSRGSFVYRGTQVVTGATARKVAEDLLRQRPGVGPAPRQAFESRDRAGGDTSRSAGGSGRPDTASSTRSDASSPGSGTAGMTGRPASWSRPQSDERQDAQPARQPDVLATAAVGGVGGLAVTLPVLLLGMTVLDPPLQPAFAVLLLVLAALAGAIAATIWTKIKA